MQALFKQIRSQHQSKIDPELQKQYSYCGHDITLQTDPEAGVAGVVWFAYPRVMNWIEEQVKNDPDIFKDKKAIELGAGTGLAGILLALCGAKTTLTDREEVLPLLNINIKLNDVSALTTAVELEWGEAVDNFETPFDVLIVCDCIYNLQYGPQLLDTMVALSGDNTKIIFAYSTRNKEGEEKYFQTIKEHFVMERLEGGDPEDKEPNLFVLRRIASK